MELKGTKKDWSDYDSKDGDGERKSIELPKPAPPEAVPERAKAAFDLGIIFDRKDVPPETLQVVSQEHDHVKPEFVQGVTPGGAPEQGEMPAAIQAAQHREATKAAQQAGETDDDDEEEDETTASDQPAPQAQKTQPRATNEQAEPSPSKQPLTLEELIPPADAQGHGQRVAAPVPEFNSPQQPPTSEAAQQAYYPPSESAAYQTPQEPPRQPPAAGGGGGNKPPQVPFEQAAYPEPPDGPYGAPAYWRQPRPNPLPEAHTSYAYQDYQPQPDTITKRTFETEQQKLRRQMAARMILMAALTWYLARRPVKAQREQVRQLQETSAEQQQQFAALSYEQQAAQRRIAEQQQQIEQFTKPQTIPFEQQAGRAFDETYGPRPHQSAEKLQAVGPDGRPIVLQPGQRLEMAGAYATVVDEQNNIVPNAIVYGEAYHQDVQREQAPVFGAQNRPSSGYPSAGGFGTILASGQVATDHSLPMNASGQTPDEEAQHLLAPGKPNPVAAAITSPWLWLGVGIILIAFFAAATI